MPLPKKIKEGYFTYKINKCNGLVDDKDLGQLDFTTKEISIDVTKPEQCQKETLIHEMIHMWLETLHVPNEFEENLCDFLSLKMINTFRQNPKLVKYLFEE